MRYFFKYVFLLFGILFINTAYGLQIRNVILITIDGTRHQDFFNPKMFSSLWSQYSHLGEFAGGPTGISMITASTPMSLPSYLSITTGAVQPCKDNFCSNVTVPTVFDALSQNAHLARRDMAIFSEWEKIGNVISANKDQVAYANTGNQYVVDPETGIADDVMQKLNRLQDTDKPLSLNKDRYDKYVYLQAKHYLQTYQPRLLWISLGDMDTKAHLVNKSGYEQSLRETDARLDDLFKTLKEMPEYTAETVIILMPDHGRGNGIWWTSHGDFLPESKNTFLYLLNGESLLTEEPPEVPYLTESSYSSLSVRPFIESVFGI